MPVTERLRAAGSWSLNLREDTPKSILDDLDITTRGFGLLVITPAKVPSTQITAALLRGMSRYVGIYRARPNDYTMQGAHASILLGDEDGKGEILSAATSQVAASLSTWMTALLPSNGIAKGTVSGGSTLSASYIYMSRRQAIDAVCDGCGADWLVRCNSAGDLVLDASPKATLFGSAAVALATRRALGGKDPAIPSLRATQLATAMDVEDYSTKIWLIARGDGGATVGTATAGSVPYFGPGGAAIKMERIIDAPNVDPGNETTIATLQLANFSTLRRAITLSTDEYDISGVVRPGQNIYVYDPVINLYDNAVEQYFRGETIHPILLRCFGHTWPIRAGFGVYFQTPEASPRIINLSDWVIPEDSDTTVEVGALSRQVGGGVVTLGTPIDNTAGPAVGSVGGIQRVTVATRPTVGLYAGMLIYETDTFKVMQYQSATTGWTQLWDMPWGVLGVVKTTTLFDTVATHTTYQDSGLSVAVTWPANRKHRVTYTDMFYAPGGVQPVYWKVLQGAGLVLFSGSSQGAISATQIGGGSFVQEIDQASAGSAVTFKTQLAAGAANTSVRAYRDANFIGMLMVEDIGPNGNPA